MTFRNVVQILLERHSEFTEMEEGNSSKVERDLIKTTKSKTCLLDLGISQISNTCPWKK